MYQPLYEVEEKEEGLAMARRAVVAQPPIAPRRHGMQSAVGYGGRPYFGEWRCGWWQCCSIVQNKPPSMERQAAPSVLRCPNTLLMHTTTLPPNCLWCIDCFSSGCSPASLRTTTPLFLSPMQSLHSTLFLFGPCTILTTFACPPTTRVVIVVAAVTSPQLPGE